ncbi:hypothetical protein VYU27_004495 [Nannochloropsis oceanica]
MLCKARPSHPLESQEVLELWENNKELFESIVNYTATTLHCWRSFVCFLKQKVEMSESISTAIATPATTTRCGKGQTVEKVMSSENFVILPAVAPTITNHSSPVIAGTDLLKDLSWAVVRHKSGSMAKLRPVYQPKTGEAMIEEALNTREQAHLPPQTYHQTKVYPPPNRPGATAIPIMWPPSPSFESMGRVISRSHLPPISSSSMRIKLTKRKRTLAQHLQQSGKRRKTNLLVLDRREQQLLRKSLSLPPTSSSIILQADNTTSPAGAKMDEGIADDEKVVITTADTACGCSGGSILSAVEGYESYYCKETTVAQTLLSLASASWKKSTSTIARKPEAQGKNSITSTNSCHPPSHDSIQI